MTCTCIHAHASHMNVKSRHAQLQVLHGANTHMHVRVFRCQFCFKLQHSSNHRATVALATTACGPVAGGGGVAKAPAGHSAKAGVDGVGAGSFTCGCTRAAPGEDDDSAFTATAFGPGEVAGLGDFAKVAGLGGFANAEGDGEVAGLGAIAKKARSDSSGLTGVVGLDLTAVLAEASAGSAATLFAEALAGSAGERFGMMESHNRGTGETELGLVPNSSTSIRAKH